MPSASVFCANSVSRRGDREWEILRRNTGAVLAAEAFFRVGVSALCALAERPRWWAEAVKTGGKGPKNDRFRDRDLHLDRRSQRHDSTLRSAFLDCIREASERRMLTGPGIMAGSATTQLLGRKEVRDNYGRLQPDGDGRACETPFDFSLLSP